MKLITKASIFIFLNLVLSTFGLCQSTESNSPQRFFELNLGPLEIYHVTQKENIFSEKSNESTIIFRGGGSLNGFQKLKNNLQVGFGIGISGLACSFPNANNFEEFYNVAQLQPNYPDSIKGFAVLDPSFSNTYITFPLQIRASKSFSKRFKLEGSLIWENEFQVDSRFSVEQGRPVPIDFGCIFCSGFERSPLTGEPAKTLERFYRSKTSKYLSKIGIGGGYKVEFRHWAFGHRFYYFKYLKGLSKEFTTRGFSQGATFYVQIKI